jgi:voltage-gated potassium channel
MAARMQAYFWERTRRAVASRRVFPYLAAVTFLLGLTAGIVVRLVDSKDFPTVGDGVWWAIVTLGTVGYGDLVPTTVAGRVVGSILIVVGVTFISFLTATVTSAFVSAEQEEAREIEQLRQEAAEKETQELLRRVTERLDAIEAKLAERR